jgi:hypothetical protein
MRSLNRGTGWQALRAHGPADLAAAVFAAVSAGICAKSDHERLAWMGCTPLNLPTQAKCTAVNKSLTTQLWISTYFSQLDATLSAPRLCLIALDFTTTTC